MALTLASTATAAQKNITQVIQAMFAAQPGHTILNSLADSVESSDLATVANLLVPFAENTGSAADFAAEMVANLGISTTAGIESADVEVATAFVEGKLTAAGDNNWGSVFAEIAVLFSGLEDNAVYGTAAKSFNSAVEASLIYSLVEGNTEIVNDPDKGTPAKEIGLTDAVESITGSSGDDDFIANVADNLNTFQSGDIINGGTGTDSLYAEVGRSSGFAISAKTDSVENFFINARSDTSDSNDNNLQNNFVQIDAGDIKGDAEWWTNGSRADVVIEDIRINDDEITRDITFGMRDTDPGSANADNEGSSLHAYFDANSLRNAVQSTAAQLQLKVIDGKNAPEGNPLQDTYNDAFGFTIDGVAYYVQNVGLTSATTYEGLLAAVQAGISSTTDDLVLGTTTFKGTAAIADTLSATLGANFTVSNDDGQNVTGTAIVLTTSAQGEMGAVGWLSTTDAVTPADTNVTYKMNNVATVASSQLITSEVILDNVGRGSEGGDLEIGTMSTRGGVEQFDVKVEDSSWVNNMRSTNEALEVVTIVTSDVPRDEVTTTGQVSTGELVIGAGLQNGADNLTDLRTKGEHVNTNGLIDVRTLNASSFLGDLTVGASLTERSMNKYLHLIEDDVEGAEIVDDIIFDYATGSGNDKVNLAVDSNLLADSDFSLEITTATGDDMVMTRIDQSTANSPIWYTSHVANGNFSIDTGAGDDKVETLGAGNATIVTGAGNDAIYTDNTGALFGAFGAPNAALQATADADEALDVTAQALVVIVTDDVVTLKADVAAVAFDTDDATTLLALEIILDAAEAAGTISVADNAAIVLAFGDDATADGDLPGGLAAALTAVDAAIDANNETDQATAAAAVTAAAAAASQALADASRPFVGVATADDIEGGVIGDKAVWTANNDTSDQVNSLDLADVRSFLGIKGQVRVEFNGGVTNTEVDTGITSAWINIDFDSNAFTTSSYQVRQAIKDAVNNDAVLSKLLIVKDGPSDTFVIESLIDGEMQVDDLNIDFRAPQASGANMTGFTDGQRQVTAGEETAAVRLATHGAAADALFNAAQAEAQYAPTFAQTDTGGNLTGADSDLNTSLSELIASDNIINAGTGDDVIVLGTDDNSNDTVVFEGSFGTDTIVNFEAAVVAGQDLLDFTSYMDTTDTDGDGVVNDLITVDNNAVLNANNNISIVNADVLLNGAPTITTAATTTALTGLVLAVHNDVVANDAHYADTHVADVYTAVGASDGTATTVALALVGTIDLTDVDVATLTVADFVQL